MATSTGQQFIDGSLPVLPVKAGHPAYYTVTASSVSTSIVAPPKTLASFPVDTLKNLLARTDLAPRLRATYTVPTLEKTHEISVEADIERAMHLYLVNNINLILEEFPNASVKLLCRSQVTAGRSRTDMMWQVNGKAVLILEAKNLNAIRESDWIPAVVTATRTADDIIKSIPVGGKTALHDNAGVLSQQAAKYAAICPVVILFDWRRMVLLDLKPKDQRTWDDRTNPVQYMFTNDQTSAGATTWTHRKFLLAAFLHGMRKQGLIH